MKGLFVASAAVATASAATVTGEVLSAFLDFAKEHGKVYESDAEFAKRAAVFADNLDMVAERNQANILAGGEAVHGITKFSDMSRQEFKDMYLTYQYKERTDRVTPQVTAPAADVDWRTKGAVQAVKDQGQCGSCWAFSAVAAIESYYMLAGNDLMSLSEQQINSCDRTDGGCNGGNTETAYNYVRSNGGITTEEDYPYTSGTTGRSGSCETTAASHHAVAISGYKSVNSGEANLANALTQGPVSVCVAADAFQTYRSGILTSCPGYIDHCVQAVGMTADYWIVRNSWGTGWGESGYIRVARGKDLCHIADDVTYPTF